MARPSRVSVDTPALQAVSLIELPATFSSSTSNVQPEVTSLLGSPVEGKGIWKWPLAFEHRGYGLVASVLSVGFLAVKGQGLHDRNVLD